MFRIFSKGTQLSTISLLFGTTTTFDKKGSALKRNKIFPFRADPHWEEAKEDNRRFASGSETPCYDSIYPIKVSDFETVIDTFFIYLFVILLLYTV